MEDQTIRLVGGRTVGFADDRIPGTAAPLQRGIVLAVLAAISSSVAIIAARVTF